MMPGSLGSSKAAYITELNENDVILGRGELELMMPHEGNVRFLQLVHEMRPHYAAATGNHAKTVILCKIIQLIASRNGRFLRRVESTDATSRLLFPAGVNTWEIVDNAVILEKVQHACRINEHADDSPQHRSTAGIPLLFPPLLSTNRPTPIEQQQVESRFDRLVGDLGQFAHLPSQPPIGLWQSAREGAGAAELRRLQLQQELVTLRQQREQQQQRHLAELLVVQSAASARPGATTPSFDSSSPSFLQRGSAQQPDFGSLQQASRLTDFLVPGLMMSAETVAALRVDCERRTQLQDAIALEGQRLGLSPISAIRRSVKLVPGPFSSMLGLVGRPAEPTSSFPQGSGVSGALNPLQPQGIDRTSFFGHFDSPLVQSPSVAISPPPQELLDAARAIRSGWSRGDAMLASPARRRKRSSSAEEEEKQACPRRFKTDKSSPTSDDSKRK